jgi:hypothetical protein
MNLLCRGHTLHNQTKDSGRGLAIPNTEEQKSTKPKTRATFVRLIEAIIIAVMLGRTGPLPRQLGPVMGFFQQEIILI